MRVPNYNNVTVNGTLTGNPWDGGKYGVVVFRVNGTLSGTGSISANGLGFRGGPGVTWGEGIQGTNIANSGGGGPGYSVAKLPKDRKLQPVRKQPSQAWASYRVGFQPNQILKHPLSPLLTLQVPPTI